MGRIHSAIGTHSVTIAFTTVLIVCALSCRSHTSSPPSEQRYEITMTAVSSDSLGVVGRPGYYYKLIGWNVQWEPTWGDSVISMLLDSGVVVLEFIYPAELGICHNPFQGALEIAKVALSDTAVKRFGYSVADSVFTPFCIPRWRHYVVQWNLAGV